MREAEKSVLYYRPRQELGGRIHAHDVQSATDLAIQAVKKNLAVETHST